MFSKGTGIVCEYNPFHKGHAYQIAKVKEMGAKFVVCAMSGDFVQRGKAAFQDKLIRAKNAITNGADIVLEIPFPFSSMGAEGFGMAGMEILEKCGLCSSFAFGSECDDTKKLQAVADILTKDFHKKVLLLQKDEPSLSYASARQKLVEAALGKDYASLLQSPNDILGIEYLKANKSLCPITIKRSTPRGGFDENFASSSYIRKSYFQDNGKENIQSLLPKCYDFSGIYNSKALFENHLLLSLMAKSPSELSGILEVAKGYEYAIIKAAKEAQSYEDLCRMLSSKSLTDAKISRMILFSLFGITKEYSKTVPAYTFVLASSDYGKEMLKKYKSDKQIIVASRVSHIKKDKAALHQYNISRRCSEVLYKCEALTK